MTRVRDRVEIRTVNSVGKTREVTPEGYLLCRDVAVARTGQMLYGAGEVPLDDDAGLITVNREADELFAEATLASFEGKAVTNDHPSDWVNPKNWKDVAVGTAFNFRRGAGVEDHLMFADLLITDEQAINEVQKGKVEISLGYDADYTQAGKGKGYQTNILGNHIALVEHGRCGSRCKIGDGKTMPEQKKGLLGRLRGLKKTVDEALSEAEKNPPTNDDDDETGEGDNDAPVDSKTGDKILAALKSMDAKYEKRFKDMEKRFKDAEAEPGGGKPDEEEEPTQDDVLEAETASKTPSEGEVKYTGDSLAELRSRAEILSPGIKLPTLDAANKGVGKLARTCKCNALRAAYTGDNQKMIDAFTGGRSDFEALSAVTLDAAFIGASELIRQRNNSAGARSGISTRDFGRPPASITEINANNRQFWKDRANQK